ncbi:hypothetical protein CRUP_007479 [Coryphaenoides rupestris]|nr:hypothetical protein CRUP_007479 [Coryphaenoides rupestris]
MLPLDLAKEDYQASPAKHRSTEVLAGQEMAQSPSSRTRGTWSPSASPSTSILKMAQKRPLEEDTVSPLVKSRRVSFANPIQHQELADDIDRRSNVIRTSSPKRVKTNIGVSQPKYVTTPTKGLLVLSPRTLHSSTIQGHKSSKKCLIPKMSQETRTVPKDCVYPALVFCSAPVEAVLPQIASNIWPRGFCQLMRAKNIKTVGDLCSLTPSDINALPIRKPKIANVKKALELYEQLRKIRNRGGALDQLKGFEEVEKMMGSAPEEANTSLNLEEDDKSLNEALATELLDESADEPPEQEGSHAETATQAEEEEADDNDDNNDEEEEEEEEKEEEEKKEGRPIAELTSGRQLAPGGLLSQVDALSSRAMAGELGLCTAQQLVQLHDTLGGVMRSVMLELQGRLCHASSKH